MASPTAVQAVPSMEVVSGVHDDESETVKASSIGDWAGEEGHPAVSMAAMPPSDEISPASAARAEEALDRLVERNQVDRAVAHTLRQALERAVRKRDEKEHAHLVDVKDEGLEDSQDPDARIKAGRRPFKPSSSKRQQLTAEEAAEIYSMRPVPSKPGQNFRRGSLVQCKTIAPKYGVTAKTVLDIWHGRTWTQATRHLWTEEDVARREQGQKESDEEETAEETQKASQITSPAQFMPMAGGMVVSSGLPGAQLPNNLLLAAQVAGAPGMGQMGMQGLPLQQMQALQQAQAQQQLMVHHHQLHPAPSSGDVEKMRQQKETELRLQLLLQQQQMQHAQQQQPHPGYPPQ